MPRQDGIGSRAPTLVVALCRWWWTCHVDVPHTRFLQANLKEFTIVSHEIQYIVIRNSKLVGPQEDHSYCPSSEEYERYRKNWYITLNKSGRNAPMKLRSDFREALTKFTVSTVNLKQFLFINTKNGIRRRWNENWWSS